MASAGAPAVAQRRWRRLAPWLLAVVAGSGFVGLGVWQLRRADEKAALIAAFELRSRAPAVALAELDPADPANRFREVRVSGRYVAEHQWLLDNQLQHGQPGYRVLTPLDPGGAAAWVLVDRGWVAQGETRQVLPEVGAPQGRLTVLGRLSQPPEPGVRLGHWPAQPSWPAVVPWFDFDAAEHALGHPLERAVILLDPAAPGGYRREWAVNLVTLSPDRHRAYAVQWFSLAVAVAVTAGVLEWRRRAALGKEKEACRR